MNDKLFEEALVAKRSDDCLHHTLISIAALPNTFALSVISDYFQGLGPNVSRADDEVTLRRFDKQQRLQGLLHMFCLPARIETTQQVPKGCHYKTLFKSVFTLRMKEEVNIGPQVVIDREGKFAWNTLGVYRLGGLVGGTYTEVTFRVGLTAKIPQTTSTSHKGASS